MQKYVFLAIAVVLSVLLISAVAEGSAFGWSKKTKINLVLEPPFIVKTTSTCSETDGGPNPDVKGTCTDDADGGHQYTDSCVQFVPPFNLKEYDCFDDGTCHGNYAVCKFGCEDGACVICGNGKKQDSEECDDVDFGGKTCADFGFTGGTLLCDACKISTITCTTCGNGAIESGELCDGSKLNGAACETFGFSAGALSCTTTCTFDFSRCYSSSQNSGQGQGYGQSQGWGNSQSSQGQQGQGVTESQSQGYGE